MQKYKVREGGSVMGKRLAVLFFAALFTCAVFSMVTGGVKAETVTLKAVTAWPKTATDCKAFTIFTEIVAEMVAKKAPGELQIQYVGGPEAVKTPDQVQALQRGMVDMVFTTTAYYLSVLPEVDALKLSDFTPSEERSRGAWAYLNQLHEKIGIYYLARLGLGTKFHLYLKKPIERPTSKGLTSVCPPCTCR